MLLFKQAGISHQALERIDELLIERRLAPQETLIQVGVYTDTLFIMIEGTVDVFTADGDQIASLTAGTSHGERYLLEPGPAAHTAQATTAAVVRAFDGAAYDQFAKEFPESAFALQAVVARRVLQELKKAQDHLRLLFETFKAS